MDILVVGGGGREHAICWSLKQSARVNKIYCAPGNAGIAQIAECHSEVSATDLDGMLKLAQKLKPDLVFVAPDDPLAMGMVNVLTSAGFRAFGPTKEAALIEASKAYSKSLMKKYGIPTAHYQTFHDMDAAISYVQEQGAPIVVKCDGLALGKGVTVANTTEDAVTAVKEMMADKKFGEAGSTLVIEECMTGPEITVLCFTDGEHYSPMPSSQDHKRAFDGNLGPNTGGMGAISPVPVYTPEIAERCNREIFAPTIQALRAEGRPFKGVLYFGLMLTPDGPKVVEYNARFGDPEAQAVLPLLDSDFLDIIEACIDGKLDTIDIRWKQASSCVVVLASGGYPVSYKKGYPISGLDAASREATVFHSGTKLDENKQFITNGGRVLGIETVRPSLEEAIQDSYRAAKKISFTDMHYRKDIGHAFDF